MIERFLAIDGANRGVYGSPRIHAELRLAHGIRVGRKARRAFDARGRDLGDGVPQARPHDESVCRASASPAISSSASSELRDRTSWVADVTYLRTWEGWLYLAAVHDAYNVRIAWPVADRSASRRVIIESWYLFCCASSPREESVPTVIVENAGAFVLNFRVSATVGGQPFHYNSGNYSTGDSKSGQVPDGATDITMVIKDERFIDDWHTIHAQNWPDASEWVDGAVAFVVSGMASTEQWKQVQ